MDISKIGQIGGGQGRPRGDRVSIEGEAALTGQ